LIKRVREVWHQGASFPRRVLEVTSLLEKQLSVQKERKYLSSARDS